MSLANSGTRPWLSWAPCASFPRGRWALPRSVYPELSAPCCSGPSDSHTAWPGHCTLALHNVCWLEPLDPTQLGTQVDTSGFEPRASCIPWALLWVLSVSGRGHFNPCPAAGAMQPRKKGHIQTAQLVPRKRGRRISWLLMGRTGIRQWTVAETSRRLSDCGKGPVNTAMKLTEPFIPQTAVLSGQSMKMC